MIDFERLWTHVIEHCAPRNHYSVHGPDHWRRVQRNGVILASLPGAKVDIVRLFALFHDSQRLNDGYDPEHGARGAAYAATLRGNLFDLPDDEFALLHHACTWHTEGKHHPDPTIGCCWDADRLDLGRVSITPSARYMSTPLGAEIAEFGDVGPWLGLVDGKL